MSLNRKCLLSYRTLNSDCRQACQVSGLTTVFCETYNMMSIILKKKDDTCLWINAIYSSCYFSLSNKIKYTINVTMSHGMVVVFYCFSVDKSLMQKANISSFL